MQASSANGGPARVVRFLAPYRVEIADASLPNPGPADVVIRAEFSGISAGTELLAYRGELDPAVARDETLPALVGNFEYPFEYGYSVVGIAEEAQGSIREGDRVFAFHPHQTRFVAAVEDVVSIGRCEPRAATLFPYVEAALQVSLDAGVRYGEVAAVLGLGPLGVLTGLLLARNGATVLAGDPKPWRRDAARRCGLDPVEPDGLPDAVRAATRGRGADVVVEASGQPDVLGPSLRLLAPEGVAIVASWYGSKAVTLPLGAEFHRRRLEIRSSQVSTIGRRAAGWDRRRRLETVETLLGELPLAELASHTFAFERAPEAYAALDRGGDGIVHVALSYL